MGVRAVTSNQQDIHKDLLSEVRKHQQHAFLKPPAAHTVAAFKEVQEAISQWSGPVILDACCGVGESTAVLAGRYPDALVIGVDKSAHRLQRYLHYTPTEQVGQAVLVRADLNDFWRLAQAAELRFQQQFVLYPNPWPKQKHLGRRWHGAPVFPAMVACGGQLTVRSNWPLYLKEMRVALACYGVAASIQAVEPDSQPMTPFERKYQQDGQPLWQLTADLHQAQQDKLAAPADVVLKFAAQPMNPSAGENSGA